MCKRYRVLLAVCIFALLATGALGQDRAIGTSPNTWTIEVIDEGSFPDGRALYLYSYEITEPMDIYYHTYLMLFYNCYCDVPPYAPLPAGSYMVGLGWENLRLVTHGDVAWGSDMMWGYTYWNQVDNMIGYVGTRPFNFNYGGSFGPSDGYLDLSTYPQFQMPPPNDPFCFWSWSTWNNNQGAVEATWTTGTMYVYIESPVVSSEAASLTSVKSLFR